MAQDDEQAWNETPADPQLEGLDPNTGQQDGPLEEDNDSPATPADDVPSSLPPDHPAMDSNIDSQETYDAGGDTGSSALAQDDTEEEKDQVLNTPS